MSVQGNVAIHSLVMGIVGIIRVPALMGFAWTAIQVGELARRGMSSLLSAALGSIGMTVGGPEKPGSVASQIEQIIPTTLKETFIALGKRDPLPLIADAVKCIVVTNVYWELTSRLLGEPSPWYNRVLGCMNPLRVDVTYLPSKVLSSFYSYWIK
jgi:hypothetical protein